jgi:hypothetical protein
MWTHSSLQCLTVTLRLCISMSILTLQANSINKALTTQRLPSRGLICVPVIRNTVCATCSRPSIRNSALSGPWLDTDLCWVATSIATNSISLLRGFNYTRIICGGSLTFIQSSFLSSASSSKTFSAPISWRNISNLWASNHFLTAPFLFWFIRIYYWNSFLNLLSSFINPLCPWFSFFCVVARAYVCSVHVAPCVPLCTAKQDNIDSCFLAPISHDMQVRVTPFNMVYLFVATLSCSHRDAPAAAALVTFPYMHQQTLAMHWCSLL